MAGAIKGIQIQFRGDTTSLDRALNNVKKEAKDTANELKYIDKAIKFNPTSVDAWKQKQIVLNKAITETKEKLNLMKQGLKEMEAQGLNAENSEEFRRMQREIDQTERHLKSLEAELKSIGSAKLQALSAQFKQVGANIENAGRQMQGLSTAAAAVTASIGALTVKSGAWADDLNTMSKRYGVGTQELQKYSAAADLVDVSTEAIVKSQTKLKKSMLSAEQGSKNQAAAFETLGVQVTNADGSLRDGEAVWQDTIAALGNMTNETERDALAMQLMGKSANELNPLIEDGGETYKRVAETMQKYGLDFIDQETLDKANQFNDELDTIKMIGLVTFQSLGTELAGYLAPALEKVVGVVGKFAEWVSKLDPKILTVVSAIAAFVAVLAPALIAIGKIATGVGAVISIFAKFAPMIKAVVTAVKLLIAGFNPWMLVVAAVVAAGILIYKNWDTIKAKALELWEAIKTAFAGIRDFMLSIWNGVAEAVAAVWDFIKLVIQQRIEMIKTIITTVFAAITTIVTTVWDGIKLIIDTALKLTITLVTARINLIQTVITTVFNAIKASVQAIWNAIKGYIINPIKDAVDKVKSAIDGLKSSLTSSFNAIKDTASSVWAKIKDAMVSPIESARDALKKVIDKIKSFFPIKLGNILSFSVPTITVGSKEVTVGDKTVKVPTFSIGWVQHALGGIYTKPTLLAGADGMIHQVGEAGAEAILPLARLQTMLDASHMDQTRLLAELVQLNVLMLQEMQKDKDFRIDGRVAGRIINDLVRV